MDKDYSGIVFDAQSEDTDFENRIVDPEYISEESDGDNPLRPRTLNDYIGQQTVKEICGFT